MLLSGGVGNDLKKEEVKKIQSFVKLGLHVRFYTATQRVKFHRIAGASDGDARVSCPARQHNCNLISSAMLPKS